MTSPRSPKLEPLQSRGRSSAKSEAAKPDPGRNCQADAAKARSRQGCAGDAADGHKIDHGAARPGGRQTDRAEQAPNGFIASPIPEVVASRTGDDDGSRRSDAGAEGRAAADRVRGRSRQRQFGRRPARAWRGLLKSRSNAPLTALRPIIVSRKAPTASACSFGWWPVR